MTCLDLASTLRLLPTNTLMKILSYRQWAWRSSRWSTNTTLRNSFNSPYLFQILRCRISLESLLTTSIICSTSIPPTRCTKTQLRLSSLWMTPVASLALRARLSITWVSIRLRLSSSLTTCSPQKSRLSVCASVTTTGILCSSLFSTRYGSSWLKSSTRKFFCREFLTSGTFR